MPGSSPTPTFPQSRTSDGPGSRSTWLNKVPEVTATFWIIKVMSTTVGETGADYLAARAEWGAELTGFLMTGLLLLALFLQLRSSRCIPWRYWLTVVLVSIVGTQITDALTDGLDVSLYVSTAAFAVALALLFALWYGQERTLSIRTIVTLRREAYYWGAVLCSFALGTAAGDLAAEEFGLGFRLAMAAFGALIVVAATLRLAGANSVLVFWIAYVLTRPLGASLGDWLSQAPKYGGMGLGATVTSALFLTVIIFLVTHAQHAAHKSSLSGHET